jgi:hypothetical protein
MHQKSYKMHLDSFIKEQYKKMNKADIEANIREAKLREAQRIKKELEDKLGHVQISITTLESSPGAEARKKKPNLQDSNLRKEFFEEEKKKAMEVAEFTKKLAKDQKERAKQFKKQEEETRKKMIEEFEQEKGRREETKKRLEQEKEERVNRMLQKSQERKEEIQKRLDLAKQRFKVDTPLYKKKEKINQVEEDQWKEMKANRKKQPINHEELAEHAKKYEELKKDQQRKMERDMSHQNIINQLGFVTPGAVSHSSAILLQDKKQREEEERQARDRLRLIEKRTRYAELVKEMFIPKTDPTKLMEIEERKKKLHNGPNKPSSVKEWKAERETSVDAMSDGETNAKKNWKPRKFKKNPLVPEPKAKPEPKLVDYLGERRKQRDSYEVEGNISHIRVNWEDELQKEDLSPEEKKRRIQEKAAKIEKQVRKSEMLLKSASPTNLHVLEHHEAVGDALIGSIKAKLALLGKSP